MSVVKVRVWLKKKPQKTLKSSRTTPPPQKKPLKNTHNTLQKNLKNTRITPHKNKQPR